MKMKKRSMAKKSHPRMAKKSKRRRAPKAPMMMMAKSMDRGL